MTILCFRSRHDEQKNGFRSRSEAESAQLVHSVPEAHHSESGVLIEWGFRNQHVSEGETLPRIQQQSLADAAG